MVSITGWSTESGTEMGTLSISDDETGTTNTTPQNRGLDKVMDNDDNSSAEGESVFSEDDSEYTYETEGEDAVNDTSGVDDTTTGEDEGSFYTTDGTAEESEANGETGVERTADSLLVSDAAAVEKIDSAELNEILETSIMSSERPQTDSVKSGGVEVGLEESTDAHDNVTEKPKLELEVEEESVVQEETKRKEKEESNHWGPTSFFQNLLSGSEQVEKVDINESTSPFSTTFVEVSEITAEPSPPTKPTAEKSQKTPTTPATPVTTTKDGHHEDADDEREYSTSPPEQVTSLTSCDTDDIIHKGSGILGIQANQNASNKISPSESSNTEVPKISNEKVNEEPAAVLTSDSSGEGEERGQTKDSKDGSRWWNDGVSKDESATHASSGGDASSKATPVVSNGKVGDSIGSISTNTSAVTATGSLISANSSPASHPKNEVTSVFHPVGIAEAGPTPPGENVNSDAQQRSEPTTAPPPTAKPNNKAIRFRHPYPLPPAQSKRRNPEDIVKSNLIPNDPPSFKPSPPKPSLTELLVAAKCDSLARRCNACGAIKVLASKKSTQTQLARTEGVLDALVYAAEQPIPEGNVEVEDAAIDARTRAVTSLLYLSGPKENRTLLFSHKGLPQVLEKVVREDRSEARTNACSALATLAKATKNRDGLVAVDGLITTLARVLRGDGPFEDGNVLSEEKKEEEKAAQDKGVISGGLEAVEEDGTESNIQEVMSGSTSPAGTSKSKSAKSSKRRDRRNKNADGDLPNVVVDNKDEGDGKKKKRKGKNNKNKTAAQTAAQTTPAKLTKTKPEDLPVGCMRQLSHSKYPEFLTLSRMNACAAILHLSKHCPVAPILCQNSTLLTNLVTVCREFENPIHTRCIEIICQLTRFPSNAGSLSKMNNVVDTLIRCGKSRVIEDRMWAVRSFQNMTADAGSRIILATGPLLTLLSVSAMRKDYEEQAAAAGSLLNLSTEPGAIVPLTNTKNVVATLVHLAHSPDSSPSVCQMACSSLATIGLWLQTLAGAGVVPEGVPPTPLPSHSAHGWHMWD